VSIVSWDRFRDIDHLTGEQVLSQNRDAPDADFAVY
jgi:hypothetical protein